MNREMDTGVFRSFTLREKKLPSFSQIADVVMLNDAQTYLVARFQ